MERGPQRTPERLLSAKSYEIPVTATFARVKSLLYFRRKRLNTPEKVGSISVPNNYSLVMAKSVGLVISNSFAGLVMAVFH
jgi:hypothetical protein